MPLETAASSPLALAVVIDPTAYKATLYAIAVLAIKMVVTISFQGTARFKAGTRPPEDEAFAFLTESYTQGVKQSYGQATGKDDDKLKKERLNDIRWQRIVMNDIENIPLGLAIAIITLFTPASPLFHTLLVSLFAFARVSHTIVYAGQMQPHRTVAFIAGWSAMVGMLANGIVGANGYKLTIF
ncbi:hypothetical protein HDU96_007985 [Phlyctochytrium bullatum]|nr:hypothetical protein HDU96_007985 [Phlyctochytrium bullatum]